MTKGQTIALSVGAGVFLLVVVVLIVMASKKGGFNLIGSNDTPVVTLPDYCDKERVGYDIYGNANSDCGVTASTPYSAPCDPDKKGYDINGFPRTDCWFGRTENPSTNSLSRQGSTSWKFSMITSNGNIKTATGAIDPAFTYGQKVIVILKQGTDVRSYPAKVIGNSTARKQVVLSMPNITVPPISPLFSGEIISA